jgi:Fe-S cluster assembly scaffold protein SufB
MEEAPTRVCVKKHGLASFESVQQRGRRSKGNVEVYDVAHSDQWMDQCSKMLIDRRFSSNSPLCSTDKMR